MQLITCNGQTVECYGKFQQDSNFEVIFDNENYDGIFADSATSWVDAVDILTTYAERIGTTVIEMTAC